MLISFIASIELGLVAGIIGSKIADKSGEGLLLDIVVGAAPVSGLNFYSLFVAVIGASLCW